MKFWGENSFLIGYFGVIIVMATDLSIIARNFVLFLAGGVYMFIIIMGVSNNPILHGVLGVIIFIVAYRALLRVAFSVEVK